MKCNRFVVLVVSGMTSSAALADDIAASPQILTPRPDPGNPALTISYLLWYSLDRDGHYAFNAELRPTGTDTTHGAYMPGPTGLTALARMGEQAAGAPSGQLYSSFYYDSPVMTDGTMVTFRNALWGPGVSDANRWGLFVGAPGALSLVARQGSAVPEVNASATMGVIGSPQLAGPGRVVFAAELNDPAISSGAGDSGVWAWSGGQRTPIALYNQPAPGVSGGLFAGLTNPEGYTVSPPPNPIVANRSGTVAIQTELQSFQQGIWTHSPSAGLRLAALQGQTTFTGLNAGITLARQSRPALNDTGLLALRCFLTRNALVTEDTDTAVVLGTPLTNPGSGPTHSFRVLSREGDSVPGRDPAWHIGTFHYSTVDNNLFSNPVLNSSGSVAFMAELRNAAGTSSFGYGIFRYRGAGLETIVATGDLALDRSIHVNPFYSPVISDQDDVAFLGGQSNVPGTSGLFVYSGGVLRTVALLGDRVQVGPGSFRTISSLVNQTSGFPSPDPQFDANRDLHFWAMFTDGSTAMLVTHIPCPSGIGALVLAGLGIHRGRRR
jgi:hypothetical protein